MINLTITNFVHRLALLPLLAVLAAGVNAQCVDSSEVNDFRVRSVKFRSLFGRVPRNLKAKLESHKGDSYSAKKASEYIREIDQFLDNDPLQQKYERLVANKLKLSIKGTYTELDCVRKVLPTECEESFPNGGVTHCVDVSIRRYSVEVDALNSSPYLLLLPRSALTALYGAFPKPLLALNPEFDLNQDRRFGSSLSVTSVVDLIKDDGEDKPVSGAETDDSGASPASSPDTAALTRLLLNLSGRKSLSNDFYVADSGLILERRRPLRLLQSVRFDGKFSAQHAPHGDGELLRNAAQVGLQSDLRLKRGPFQLINFGGSYRWSHNRFTASLGARDIANENAFEARTLIDGVVKRGMLRAGLWFDGANPNGAPGQYRRLAGLVGYGKDFVIPRKKKIHKIQPPELEDECWTMYADEPSKNESAVGVEIVAGAGGAWGDVPEHARFFAGNLMNQFLYDDLGSSTLQAFPTGALLRSFGQKQAGVTAPKGIVLGATSYWHANVSVSIPVSAWSAPLIPHAWVGATPLRDDDSGFDSVPEGELICRDLKYMVKRAVRRSGMTLMINQTAFDRLTDQQKKDFELQEKPELTSDEEARLKSAKLAYADAKAKVRPEIEAMFKRDILPISDFIADHANIIAVKPLLMFDVANLGSRGGLSEGRRYGAGAGLEIEAVLARFDFGYIFGLNRMPGEPRGNFIARLVFKRLF